MEHHNEVMLKTGGVVLRQFITRIHSHYTMMQDEQEADPDNVSLRPADPYGELAGVMNEFFMNEDISNEMTMISVEDLCKVLDIAGYLG